MYVCCCLGITDSEIEAHIAAGAGSLETVMLCSRAGTRCGTCRSEIAQMIAAYRPAHDSMKPADGRVHLSVSPPDHAAGPGPASTEGPASRSGPGEGADAEGSAPKSAA